MPALTNDEWTKVVDESWEDDYTFDVDGEEGIYLHIGDEPREYVKGLRIRQGAMQGFEIDRGEAVWAKSQSATDTTVRVVPGILPSNSTERAVSVQTSVELDAFDEAGGTADLAADGSTTVSVDPDGRSDQLVFLIQGSAGFNVEVQYAHTTRSFSSTDAEVDEVVPVNTITQSIDVVITDTSGGAQTVAYDMVVV